MQLCALRGARRRAPGLLGGQTPARSPRGGDGGGRGRRDGRGCRRSFRRARGGGGGARLFRAGGARPCRAAAPPRSEPRAHRGAPRSAGGGPAAPAGEADPKVSVSLSAARRGNIQKSGSRRRQERAARLRRGAPLTYVCEPKAGRALCPRRDPRSGSARRAQGCGRSRRS